MYVDPVLTLHNIGFVMLVFPFPKTKTKMTWKEQKLKTLGPPENAAIAGNISAQTITSIFISELTQVKEVELFA